MDNGTASIFAAGIAALASVFVAWLNLRQNRKINETHKQVAINSHKSDPPTLLDRFDLLYQKVDLIDARVSKIESKLDT